MLFLSLDLPQGPICIIIFYIIQLLSSRMLAMVYCVNGVEHARYHHAVNNILGKWDSWGVAFFQILNCVLITIAYTITGALSMKTWKLTLLFSAAQVILSQVPNLESAWWVSGVGVATSLFYCMVALVLGLVYSGNHLGTVGGIQANQVNKAFAQCAWVASPFAYSFSLILLEIQDTMKQPPAATKTMKRAVDISVTGAFFFYLTVAVAGYVSLGNEVPGMVLAGFPDAPKGVLIAANVAIMLHMVSAYQSHVKAWRLRGAGVKPVGAITDAEKAGAAVPAAPYPAAPAGTVAGPDVSSEEAVRARVVRSSATVPTLRPVDNLRRLSQTAAMYHVDTGVANETVPLNDENYLLPFWMRLLVRTAYVAFSCIISVVLPFFGSIGTPSGAVQRKYWVYKPGGGVKWAMLIVGFVMFVVCGAATVAAVRDIILGWTNFKIFGD
ncbi:hypothetical protein COHA_006535 [Chlorella ohadii]|uniref:Amino acid transporter transmembrane domain-containing protein n=1 Tax=Chlorella ohadii TaxID=2649997 RepID=A0AAD5DP61_9CHLO|nr:hypothetical protein COHA_006535 [Chlorella ohadii]